MEEDLGVSDFWLVFASVPPVCAAAPASLDARERRVEAEAGVVFVVHPVFFGWEDLAEEKQEEEKQIRGKLDLFFPAGAPVSSHSLQTLRLHKQKL